MGFSIDGIGRHFTNQISSGTTEKKEISRENKVKQFDEILIASNGTQVEERKMVEQLKSRVMSEVNQSTSEGKIEELRNRVSEGRYQMNINELAGRIMLQRGDVSDE